MWPLAISLSLAFWLSACGKKQDEAVTAKVRGNIATDGLTASSESMINGQLLRVAVNRLYVSQSVTNPTNYGWPTPSYNQGPVVNIDLNINGTNQVLQYQVNPYSYSSGNAWQWAATNTMASINVAGFQVWYEGRCDSHLCEHLWVNLVFSGNPMYGPSMSQAKQIGLYRINSQNRLAAALEMITTSSQTLQTNNLILELNTISQQ